RALPFEHEAPVDTGACRGCLSRVLSTNNAEELARARRVEDLVVAAVGNEPRAERGRRVAELGQAYAERAPRCSPRPAHRHPPRPGAPSCATSPPSRYPTWWRPPRSRTTRQP